MSLLQRLFQKKNTKQPQAAQAEELVSLRALDSFMTLLLEGDHFVAKSEYKDKLATYSDLVHWFDVLQSSGTMDDYCRKNAASQPEITALLNRYKSFQELIDVQNERYITSKMQTEKSYLDCILKDCDPNILLDDDQRRVVLTDEDYCLVVAGAGAGKTTTVAAKVKYLVDKQGVDPSQILVISFTNKAVNELKQRIIGELHIECPIATFHSTGNAIIHKHNPDKLNIVDDGKLYYVVQDYFRNNVLKNESAVNLPTVTTMLSAVAVPVLLTEATIIFAEDVRKRVAIQTRPKLKTLFCQARNKNKNVSHCLMRKAPNSC